MHNSYIWLNDIYVTLLYLAIIINDNGLLMFGDPCAKDQRSYSCSFCSTVTTSDFLCFTGHKKYKIK